jgi:LuxR family maltose regulon positive regulatory protein
METPLLQTKLYVPPPRPELVPRARLVERLNQGLRPGCKLALISAPAGFGKTTLANEWIHQVDVQVRVGWVSLDSEDNELSRFLAYLVAAIRKDVAGLGVDVLAMMQSPQPPAAETVLAALINDLADQLCPVAIVLDDFHEITAEPVHDAFVFLLGHLPPHVHLVIATRTDPPWPLARLRTRQEAIELRAQDLRFTSAEATAFLNSTMALELSTESIALLDARTEGWIAGLQMAALSIQGGDAARAESFIRAFSGSHRFVLDYLVEEVLDRQDDRIQTFLLKTSVLDRLTAPLCDAVLTEEKPFPSRSRSDSQSILTRLEQANLFLVPLDDERRWYRYHHLFADLLRRRLQETSPGLAADSHSRASEWYESQGSIHEAISHALAAADHGRAAYLVERYGGQAFRYGEGGHIARWIAALPEEMVRSRPLLCLARSWILSVDPATTDRAQSWLERALALSAAHPRPLDDLDGTCRTDHDLISRNARLLRIAIARHADPERLIDLCLETLQVLSDEAQADETLADETLAEEVAYARGFATYHLAQAYRRLGDAEAAARMLAQAGQLGLATEGHVFALIAAGIQAKDAWERGELYAVASICQETMSTLIQPAEQADEHLSPQAYLIYVLLGQTLVEWNALEEAEPLLIRSVELAERVVQQGAQIDDCCALARLYCIQRCFRTAHAWLDRALQACRQDAGA